MKRFQLTSRELNRIVRRNFSAKWYDVEEAEIFQNEKLMFVVTPHVKRYQQAFVKRIAVRDSKFITGGLLNDLCKRKVLEAGKYIVTHI
jgi:hypothetical protein